MTRLAIEQAMTQAIARHRAGRFADAEQIYRQVLTGDPENVDAIHLLGVAMVQQGRATDGAEIIRRAICNKPDVATFHNSLGNALKSQKRLDEAIAEFDHAIALDAKCVEALCSLGDALNQTSRFDRAADVCRRALQINPQSIEALNNLGNALGASGAVADAVQCYRRAIGINDGVALLHINLADALLRSGDACGAADALRIASRLEPNNAETHFKLGNALRSIGQFDSSAVAYQRAIQLQPAMADAHLNLGGALRAGGKLDEATIATQNAIAAKPEFAQAYSNLAALFCEQGELDQSIAASRKAIELDAASPNFHTNLLYAMFHHRAHSDALILCESRHWARRHAPADARIHAPHENDRSRDRRLRIGYLSSCLNGSADAHYILPLLENHDRGAHEVFCYSQSDSSDGATERMRACAHHWRDIRANDAAAAAAMIRADGVDVLINISRPASKCIAILAHRPAPVQATWLTFASCTTGLRSVDWRISDEVVDPPAQFGQAAPAEPAYSENTIHLPRTAWCYDALSGVSPSTVLPLQTNGFVTFGSLNRASKIDRDVLDAWSDILLAIPDARMLILSPAGHNRLRIMRHFAVGGIQAERVEFLDSRPRDEYLAMYHRVDLALDAFPFGGHTTTMDALWMGVPVITLGGQRAVGRVGASALRNVQCEALIAGDRADYVTRAVRWAKDAQGLAALRADLPGRMRRSPLMDGKAFAHEMEMGYRRMWRQWCDCD